MIIYKTGGIEAHFSISFYSSQAGQKHECPSVSLKHVQAAATETGPKHTQDYGTKEDIAGISVVCYFTHCHGIMRIKLKAGPMSYQLKA